MLYKFRNWKDEVHKNWLLKREIFFTSPARLNDPFDCAINYRYDLLSEEEKFEKYRKYVRDENRMLNDDEVDRQARNWMRQDLLKKDQILMNNSNLIRQQINEKIGVLSLTKTKKTILLWSHYSDQHKGICIGYSKKILLSHLTNEYNTSAKIFYDIDVDYSTEYPLIIPNKDLTPEQYFKIPLGTKSSEWSYEDEYRILLYNGANERTTLPIEAIVEVNMACNMPEKDQIVIGEFVRKNLPHVILYLCEPHEESFELKFKRMN